MATTVTASNVSPNGATLTGVVDPEGSGTAYHFEYGSTNGYGTTTADSSAGSGTSNLSVAALIGNLSPATNYHFRLVATNANGVVDGADQTFSTPPAPPVLKPRATTSPASHVGQSGARLNGVVNPAGSRTTWFFEYGTTSTYGLQSSTRSAASGSTDISVSCAVSGLARHTAYHFGSSPPTRTAQPPERTGRSRPADIDSSPRAGRILRSARSCLRLAELLSRAVASCADGGWKSSIKRGLREPGRIRVRSIVPW